LEIGVVYNFGVHKGGGDYVFLNILEVLKDLEYDVSLITSNPSGLYEANSLFDKNVKDVNICHIKTSSFLPHPYTIAYIGKKVAEKYDLLLISDDLPKCLKNDRFICYINYSHATRFKFKNYIARKYWETSSGKVSWWIHERLFPRFFSTHCISNQWLLIVNSWVTFEHTLKTFDLDPKSLELLHPPVDSAFISEIWRKSKIRKENLVVSIGRFEPDKGFNDVLEALAFLEGKINVDLCLIGFSYDDSYLEALQKTIRDKGLEGKVELLINADRKSIIDRLLRAKTIVHSTLHEPFGIAVVEGMAAGCVPIVRKGFNGPWLEITQKGNYGMGFETIGELASILEMVIGDYDSLDVEKIRNMSSQFDKDRFKKRFSLIFNKFLENYLTRN